MDDIIWPDVLITYAKLAPGVPPSVPSFCLQLISGNFSRQPPLNLMHEEGRAVDAALYRLPPRSPGPSTPPSPQSPIHLYLEGSVP